MPISKEIIGMIKARFEQAKTPPAYGDLWNLYIKKGVPDYVLLEILSEKDTPQQQQPSVTDISEQLSGQTILPSPTMSERDWVENQEARFRGTPHRPIPSQEEKAEWTPPERPSFGETIQRKWDEKKQDVEQSWKGHPFYGHPKITGTGTPGDVWQGLLSGVTGGGRGPKPNFTLPSGEEIYVPQTYAELAGKSLGGALWFLGKGRRSLSPVQTFLEGSVQKSFKELSPVQRRGVLGPVAEPKRLGPSRGSRPGGYARGRYESQLPGPKPPSSTKAEKARTRRVQEEQQAFTRSQMAESAAKTTQKALAKERERGYKAGLEAAEKGKQKPPFGQTKSKKPTKAELKRRKQEDQTFKEIQEKVQTGQREVGKLKDIIKRPETTPGRRKRYREFLQSLYLPRGQTQKKQTKKPKTKPELKREKEAGVRRLKKGKEFVTQKTVKSKGQKAKGQRFLPEKWERLKRRREAEEAKREAERLRVQRTGVK